MIVKNTSIFSVSLTPHNSVYQASKAAAAMFSDHQRIEMESFGIRVVDLKTGCVHTNFHNNRSDDAKLPPGSIYGPVKELTERAIDAKRFSKDGFGGVFKPRGWRSVTAEPGSTSLAR